MGIRFGSVGRFLLTADGMRCNVFTSTNVDATVDDADDDSDDRDDVGSFCSIVEPWNSLCA